MKIKNLIEKLQKYDPELDVILSSDEEGNTFSYLRQVFFDPDTKFFSQFGGFMEESDVEPNMWKKAKNSVTLFP